MKKKKHIFLKIFLGLFTLLILISAVIGFTLSRKAAIKSDVLVNIPRNTSVSKAIELFNEKELLTPNWYYKYIVRIYSKITGDGIFAGSYMFQ